jgi:hypothetical protein
MIRKIKTRIEEQHQVAFVAWFCLQYPQYAKLLTLGSFGENVGERRMARLKQMGLTPGFPDLFLAVPIEIYEPLNTKKKSYCYSRLNGLYIEMKTKRGKISPEQLEMHKLLREQNYKVDVCRSWHEAMESILVYFGNC